MANTTQCTWFDCKIRKSDTNNSFNAFLIITFFFFYFSRHFENQLKIYYNYYEINNVTSTRISSGKNGVANFIEKCGVP